MDARAEAEATRTVEAAPAAGGPLRRRLARAAEPLARAQRAFNDTMQSYNDAQADYARSLYLIDSTIGKTVTQ